MNELVCLTVVVVVVVIIIIIVIVHIHSMASDHVCPNEFASFK